MRRQFGLPYFYALIGGLTAMMSWVTDAHVKVIIGPVTFLVGSTVFFTSLLLAVFVIYVFDGPKETRTAIITVVGISILTPLISVLLHLTMIAPDAGPLGKIPFPSLRINTASVLTTISDMIFLAVAWELLQHHFHRIPMIIRTFLTLFGVMLLDVVLFNTGAFAGTPQYLSIMTGTFSERVVVSAIATPILWAYLYWQTQRQGESIRPQPILSILRELHNVKQELGAAQFELEQRHQMMRQLHENEQNYRALIEYALEGIIVVQNTRIVLINQCAINFLCVTSQDSLGRVFANYFEPMERERLNGMLHLAENSSGKIQADEFEHLGANGIHHWAEVRMLTISWREAPAVLVFLTDVTQRRLDEQQLMRKASTDTMTGLWRHSYFLEQARRAFDETLKNDRPLCLIMLDADFFKNINDQYGHPVGDQVLKHLAKLLKEEVREIDLIGRMGGEEFAVLLPDTGPAQALVIAERLRAIVSQTPLMTERGSVQLSVSAGVAERQVAMNNFDQLIEAADDALMLAKRSGRNRIELALTAFARPSSR